jgi:phosphate transport system substrate-binding protein
MDDSNVEPPIMTHRRQMSARKIRSSKRKRLGRGMPRPQVLLRVGARDLAILILLVLLVFPMGCQKKKAGITVAGSTSVEPFAEFLAEEYMMTHRQTRIYVQGGGSTAGIQAVRTGVAQIGMSSRELTAKEKDIHAVMIAKDAIAVIVHPKNPLKDFSLDRVREAFAGKIRNWRDLGGGDGRIILVTREEGSGTREAFQKMVMGKEAIALEALVQDSNGAIRQVVSSDPRAIGYISLGLVNEKVRALSISGVEASADNVINEKYALVRPFLFLFNGQPTGEAKTFLEFVMSPDSQRLLSKEGLVSVLPRSSGG